MAKQFLNIAPSDSIALAADLRYRILEAWYATKGARLPYKVTVVKKGGEVMTAEDLFLFFDSNYDFPKWVLVDNTEDHDIAMWNEDGTPDSYDEGYRFYDGNQELQGLPNLLVPRAIADRAVNLITATDETSIDIELPDAVTVDGVRRARDFILDVDNSANANDLALEFTGLGQSYAFVAADGDSVGDIMTIAGYGTGQGGDGEIVRLYFTETPYLAGAGSLPVFHVARVTLGDFVTSTTPATQGGN